jgi:membrane protease subunit HflC
LVIVTLVSMTLFTVNAREFVLVTQFGRPVATHTEPGLYVKWPAPVQSLTRFDRGTQLYEPRLVEQLTGDKKNVIIQAYVCWRIAKPLEFFRAVRTVRIAEQNLDDIMNSLIGSTLSEYTMANLFSVEEEEVRVPEMESRIREKANETLGNGYGIEVVSLGFSRIALPDENARSVYDRMEAERRTIAEKYRAEGMEEAGKIEAEADRQRSDILGQAYKEAEILRGEGDAKAAEIYSEAYGESPEFFDLVRTLDAYKKIMTENTTIILSADSDLFKYLNAKDLDSLILEDEAGYAE